MKTASAQALLLATFSLPAIAADGITDLGTLNGGAYPNSWGVNATGDVVVGYAFDGAAGNALRAFRWTPSGGMVSLGTLNGGTFSVAWDVNAAGDVVVGYASDGAAGNANRAFRWTQASGMVNLGALNGGVYSNAWGVNAAGDVVVGVATDGAAGNVNRAFRWTQAGGMVSLGTLNGGAYSNAWGVNAAGDVVVGDAADGASGNATTAFRWTQAGGMLSLGMLNGGSQSSAHRVNAAGDVVVGEANDGSAGDAQRAFRWTPAGGMVSLGTLNGGTLSSAVGVNAAGDVVVGSSKDGAAGNINTAFRWTQAKGMQRIDQWLADNGVNVSSSPATFMATAVNADGNVVVGQLWNGNAFIARVTPAGSGLIDLNEYYGSLNGSAHVPTYTLQDADLVLHGAHGSPMRGLLASGEQDMWVTGDWGGSDHRSLDGNLGAGEIGYGRGISDRIMLKIALGHSDSRQDTYLGGHTRIDGTYIVPELIAALPGTSLYASLSGYYNDGTATIKRAYLNAGMPTTSRGDTDARTAALRLRLDWLNAATLGKTALTPYTSLTHISTRVGSYTETGGGFPARWDSRKEHSTHARLGLDAVHPVNDRINLLGRIEAVHRFEHQGTEAHGQMLGLSAFTMPALSYKQNWLRTGFGVENRFRHGTGSLMLHGTTEAETPSYWLSAHYRWMF